MQNADNVTRRTFFLHSSFDIPDLKLSVAGLLLGLVAALLVGRAGSSLLFGVTATDPLTFTTISLLLTGVAAAACYFPARRAMKVEPIVALRQTRGNLRRKRL
jgi:hypothetical protein